MWDQNKQSQQPTIIITTVPTYPAVQHQEEGWWKRNYKNKPQSNSVGTASLIFISGGMSMTWNLGFSTDYHTDLHIVLSWFIGCIIGAVIGGIVCNLVLKKLITCFACILVTLSGILQVSDPSSYDAIIASRYINGIAVGLVFPLTFVLVGEEVVKSMRGMNAAAVDTMSFGCGIFIQIIYSYTWTSGVEQSFSVTQMNGCLNILWGIIGFIIAFSLLKESPLYYLARGQEEKAIDVLRQLQRPYTITFETYEQLEEHKRYLAESKEKSFLQSAIMGLPALLKLCFYRSFMALSFSFFVNYAFTYACVATARLSIWPFYIYGLARWLGAMIFMFSLDSKGRKPSMTTGFLVCCCLAFTVAGIFDDKRNLVSYDYMNAVRYLLILYQLFASSAMASSSVYLSEAFPLAVKPYYISIVFIVEMLVHIIILCSKSKISVLNLFDMPDYFYALGSLSFAFFLVAIFAMPETKWNTLRECLAKFRKILNFRS